MYPSTIAPCLAIGICSITFLARQSTGLGSPMDDLFLPPQQKQLPACRPLEGRTNCQLIQVGNSFGNDRPLLRSYLSEFLAVYERRPERDNICGIRFNHALAVHVTIKELKPETINESGVNSGVSTWFMRQAAPNTTKIISIDPLDKPICNQPVRWLDEINQERFLGKANFVDFTQIDWAGKIRNGELDPTTTLVYIDDHLPFFPRVATFLQHGFSHILLEDNYRLGQGATPGDKWATPKQLFLGGSPSHKMGTAADGQWLLDNLVSYHEFPPLISPSVAGPQHKCKPQGGFLDMAEDTANYETPLLRIPEHPQDSQLLDHIMKTLDLDREFSEKNGFSWTQMLNYVHICYMELKPLAPLLRETIFSPNNSSGSFYK